MRRAFRIPFGRTPKRQLVREVDDELAFHLDSRVEHLIAAGWEPDAARREALRQFGDVESVRHDCVALDVQRERGAWWANFFAELRQDLRYAVHALRRTPGWTTVAILTLALGVGANTAVFAVVNGVLLRPLSFPDPGRLMLVSYCQAGSFACDPGAMMDLHYLAFRDENHSFESVTTFSQDEVNLVGAGDATRVRKANVTPEFFSVMGITPQLGRAFAAGEGKLGDARVVLISDRLWRGRFGGGRNVLGRVVRIDDAPYTIVGVTPAGFDFPTEQDLWVPEEIVHREPYTAIMPVVGRLRKGVTVRQAQAELEILSRSFTLPPRMAEHGVKESSFVPRILPLRELLVHDAQRSLVIFAAAVAFVLLIACVNVANLMLMRMASRTREMAVRRTLGAGRGRLVRQLLTESAVLSFMGAAVGIALAVAGERALLALAPSGTIPLADNIRLDWRVLAFTLAIALLSGLAFGLAPALRATRRPLRESLSHGTRVASEGHRLLSGLAVAEIALALVLLTGAGLMIRSFARLRQVDLGFRPENVVTMTVDLARGKYDNEARIREFRDRVIEGLERLPASRAIGAVSWRPLDDAALSWMFTVEGHASSERGVLVAGVAGDYFRSMGIPLLDGRTFTSSDDAGAPGVVIVSQSLARKTWPNERAIGKRITIPDLPPPPPFLRRAAASRDTMSANQRGPRATRWLTVVGIVGDVVSQRLTQAPTAGVYLPLDQMSQTLTFYPETPGLFAYINFTVRASGDPVPVERAMREIVHRIDSDQPIASVAAMSDIVAGEREQPLFRTRLLTIFSLLALVLAAVGVYGVLAFSVAERTREIGIRMAMGAESGRVMRMVVTRTLMLGLLGVAIGAAGALAATRVIAKFLFDVSPTDPVTFGATAVLLMGIALLAGLVPARRASNVDPMVALRHE
jgi:predicted permease